MEMVTEDVPVAEPEPMTNVKAVLLTKTHEDAAI
jgi:hypothetical protein